MKRAGFSLIEILIAVALGGLLLSLISSLILHSQTHRASATVSNRLNASSSQVEATIRREIETAGQGLASGARFAGIVTLTSSSDTSLDTLVTTHTLGIPTRVSRESCTQLSDPCIRLATASPGDLSTGDLFIVGAPHDPLFVGRVLHGVDSLSGPCGLDCDPALIREQGQGEVLSDSVVVAHRRHYEDGSVQEFAGGCPPPSRSQEWTYCDELYDLRVVGERVDETVAIHAGNEVAYSEFRFEEVTAELGFPEPEQTVVRSEGPDPYFVWSVSVHRLYPDAERNLLVRDRWSPATEAFGPPEVISHGVHKLEIWRYLRGSGDPVREPLDELDDLHLTSALRIEGLLGDPDGRARDVHQSLRFYVATPQILDGGTTGGAYRPE